MAIMPFEMLQNVASGKVVTVGGDGLLRQYAFAIRNMRQHWLRLRQPGPTTDVFKFLCRASSLAIDAQGGALRNHTPLQQFPDTGNPNQRWRLVSAGMADPRVFFIHADNTQLVWDVPNSSSADGVVIQLYPFHGRSNQQWRLAPSEALDAFRIASVHSGLMLDVPGFSQHNGESIQQFRNNGGFNQMWELLTDGLGRSRIRSVCSRKLLDYPLQAAQRGAPAILSQYDENGGSNQLWRIESAAHGVALASVVNGFLVDVPNGSMLSGTRVQAAPNNGGGRNQLWQIV